MSMFAKIIAFLGIGLGVQIIGGSALILSQQLPGDMERQSEGGLDFSGITQKRGDALPLSLATMRDGWQMPYRRVEGPTEGPLIIAVHGSGWVGQQFDQVAMSLSDVATVVAPDLRGHGATPERRGDIDYIGQFEDDLADLIEAVALPGQEVILLGHSSGGGLVVRMAGGPRGNYIDRAILLAPFLSHKSPTTRQNSGGWAHPMVRRIVGLSMLNMVRLRVFNHLPVIWFSFPKSVLEGPLGHLATPWYSFRLNTSYAPRAKYERDIAALPPYLLIVGDQDEAFVAKEYKPLMSKYAPHGRFERLPGIGHLDVVDAPETLEIMKDYIRDI